MSGAGKRYRVVVVGIAQGSNNSPQAIADTLAERLPLPADARMAIEAGRSAVVQSGSTETNARRTATMIIKLGAEVRIEPDDAEPASAGGMDYGSVDLAPPPTPEPDLAPDASRGDQTEPVLSARPPVLMADSPTTQHPGGPPDLPVSSPGAPSTNHSGQMAAITDRPPTDDLPTEEAPVAGSTGNLVRCPAHGLLYDAERSPGCTRCLGRKEPARFRLAPGLRDRPRLWLGAGILLALLLGSVPAGLYAQSVKNGEMLERRIEAEAIRRGRYNDQKVHAAYSAARAKVDKARSRGMAFSALIWLGVSAVLILLWYRFV